MNRSNDHHVPRASIQHLRIAALRCFALPRFRCWMVIVQFLALSSTATLFGQGASATRSIVVLKPGTIPANVAARHGIAPDHVYEHAISGFAGVVPPAILRKLQNDPNVAWVEPDAEYFASGKPVPPPPPQPAQTLPYGINRIDADLNFKAQIDGIDQRVNADVAVIDTGIELSHPDLYVINNVSFVRGAKSGNDDNGHGTHVAGTIAALDNAIGVVGVAPGARLWAVKVLKGSGSGSLSDIIKGVDYVTANSAHIEVANMSLGGPNSAALVTAVGNSVAAGVVYAVAAGNSSADANNYSPANSPDVLCVSAIASNNTFAYFSNFGSAVDIAAPGVAVLSTYLGQSYATLSGTSMASPHVAGAVALYLADGTKPTNGAEVAAVRSYLQFVGDAQSGPRGFTGDSDGFPEPVVNASSL